MPIFLRMIYAKCAHLLFHNFTFVNIITSKIGKVNMNKRISEGKMSREM